MNAYAANLAPTSLHLQTINAFVDTTDRLVRKYAPLVRRIAWQVHGRARRDGQLEDLIQVGFMALIEACRSYEDQGNQFITYASMRVRGSMIDHLRREMLTSRGAAQGARRIASARQSLYQQTGRNPTRAEMADHLFMDEADYNRLEQRTITATQLPIEDVEENLLSLFQEQPPDACDVLEQAEMVGALRDQISALSEREQLVLQLHFFDELNLHEIGAVLGVSAARVCQIKARAVRRLNTALNPDSSDEAP